MASLNRVILIGNLTRDPQVKRLPSGTALCEIGLAITENWTDKHTDERKEKVVYVDCTAWNRTAEIAGEYLAKGVTVCIEGKLDLETWKDKQTGQNRSKLKVTVDRLVLLGGNSGGGRKSSGGGRQGRQRRSAPAKQELVGDESFYDAPAGEMPHDQVPF